MFYEQFKQLLLTVASMRIYKGIEITIHVKTTEKKDMRILY